METTAPGVGDRARHDALVAALLGLPGMGPSRLAALLAGAGSAALAWEVVRAGPDHPGWAGLDLGPGGLRAAAKWVDPARRVEPDRLAFRHEMAGIALVGWGSQRYPERLRQDPEPPVLLFAQGLLGQLQRPTVAIVGTRRATPYGLRLARSWAAELTEAGVVVVSGLAAGIDAAAHDGALQVLEPTRAGSGEPYGSVRGGGDGDGGSPLAVAVVGSGLDVPYPPSSRGLWRRLARVGVLLSEAPMGTRPDSWRFPARNRIIAALADVVVIIESHERGGALLTAEQAAERNRPVMAVPGSVHSPASVGPNRLIMEGAMPALSVADVLAALPGAPAPKHILPAGPAPLAPGDAALLEALGWEPADLEQLQERTGWPLGRLSSVLERMLAANRLARQGMTFVQLPP